jgi:hypothetical protein
VIHHPAFLGRPTRAQFAKNGSWETAWPFPQSECPGTSALLTYLQGAHEIAFEVFFGDAFFGVRCEGAPTEVASFSQHCVDSFGPADTGAAFFEALEFARSWSALGRSIVFAEIGAVNAWKSVGAYRLPKPIQALEDFDTLWAALSQTPLAKETQHKKAVEFAYDLPAKHWFALPVSQSPHSNVLSQSELRSALLVAS